MKALITFSLLLLALKVSSTTLPQVTIEELHKSSEFVGIVLIEEGKLVRKGKNICASQYKAQVLEVFKGNYKVGDTVVFGPYAGQGIGNKYLLFLTSKDKPFKPMATTNSVSMAQEKDYIKLCNSVLPNLTVSFHGMGSFEIGTPKQYKFQYSIKIPNKYVLIPKELTKKVAEYGDDRILGDPYWVKEGEFIGYMRRNYK